MGRYLLSLRRFWGTSLASQLEYQLNALIELVAMLANLGGSVLVLWLFYRQGVALGGWSWHAALVVLGAYTCLNGFTSTVLQPNLSRIVTHVQEGTLDFVLLKPHDAQILVSTARFQLWRVAGLMHASIVFGLGFRELGHGPSALGVLQALALLLIATAMLYSFWLLIVSVSFYAVKVDNLSNLFTSIFDAARWPASVFRGVFRIVFTFVIPLVVMTTLPAEALLGRLPWTSLLASVGGAVGVAVVARVVWLLSLRRYTSAGG
jgi:ABC-2 type transport system permease protein